MRRKTIAVAISISILMLSIMFMVLPKKSFSENENRYLQEIPKFQAYTLLNGEYMKHIETYLTDHFPFRDSFMNFKTWVYKTIGQTKINGIFLGKDEYLIEEYTKPKNSDNVIKQVNEFVRKLENCKTYFMLVPTSVSINLDKLPNNSINASQLETIQYYRKNLENIEMIDVYNTFEKVKHDVQLYYRLDHHWTTFGAYIAYIEYCKKLRIDTRNFTLNRTCE